MSLLDLNSNTFHFHFHAFLKWRFMSLRLAKKTPPRGFRKVILLILIAVLLTIIPLYLLNNSRFSLQSLEVSLFSSVPISRTKNLSSQHKYCNIFKGNWIPYAKGPYYTNISTKCVVDDRQNCMKFGRPDTGFMKWRWKPGQCELPLFDAAQFLELVRSQSMAFIGDSVARNQVESLMCLLSNVMKCSLTQYHV